MSLPIVIENQFTRTGFNPVAIAQIDTGVTPKTILQDFSGFDQVLDYFDFTALESPVLTKGAIDVALLSRNLHDPQAVAQIDTGVTPKTILQDFSAYDLPPGDPPDPGRGAEVNAGSRRQREAYAGRGSHHRDQGLHQGTD